MSEADQAKEIRRLLDCEHKKASPFAILGLDIATCELNDVNRSFRKIALLLHPDKCKLPNCADAFHVAEKAHKQLSQEVVLTQLKRADERRRERETETRTHIPQKHSSSSSSPSSSNTNEKAAATELPPIPFGTLCKLSASTGTPSTDAQKKEEIARVMACKPTDYFLILDVDPATAEVADVSRRYRRLAQALHPDKCDLPDGIKAFTRSETAHKELSDERKLVRYKLAFQQQRTSEARLRAEAARRAGQQQQHPQTHSYDPLGGRTPEERLALRKREALREHQLQSARLADEAVLKKRKFEQEETERNALAADLEKKRKEWRDMGMF